MACCATIRAAREFCEDIGDGDVRGDDAGVIGSNITRCAREELAMHPVARRTRRQFFSTEGGRASSDGFSVAASASSALR